ncbi:tyrosine-protein phosphatase non-receptor type substrate 1-like [Callorhinchus milii]|uniref:tyrosine-protein phosphatase non-receptor type substrate 1-like n=1 Tax=Callorhinchus milii TaxID=7868 RepID=UPI001C3F8D19|nr:tyrosine-protein phosphatase non-receptor type substrate 1-like [Callorhinchus milii]
MVASDVFPCLSLMGIIFTVTGGTSMRVIQYPAERTAIRGANVTFGCKFADSQSGSDTTLYWWKRGEREYLHTRPDNRRIFDYKTFQILNLNFNDSGVYICAAVHKGKIAGNGTGTSLTVHVPPTPLKIFHRDSERDSSKSLTLVCETAEFYPEDVTLTWNKDSNEVKTGIHFTKEKNSNGLYKVSSSMEETESVQSGVIYTCVVSHVSLRIPAVAVYAVYESKTEDDESDGQPHYALIAGGAAGGLVFLLLLIIIGKQCQLNKVKGPRRNQEGSSHYEEQMMHGAKNEPVAYDSLDFTSSKKTPRPKKQEERTVYTQTKQAAAGNKLTYASLDLHPSIKTEKPKSTVKNTQYAELHVRNHGGAAAAICREPKSK